jgi:hypothetical protein
MKLVKNCEKKGGGIRKSNAGSITDQRTWYAVWKITVKSPVQLIYTNETEKEREGNLWWLLGASLDYSKIKHIEVYHKFGKYWVKGSSTDLFNVELSLNRGFSFSSMLPFPY